MEKPSLQPSEERRQGPRREADRKGKLDRRKTRCGACFYWKKTAETPSSQEISEGWCGFHNQAFTAESFACVVFKASGGSQASGSA